MKHLAWRLKRVRRMAPAELAWRARTAAHRALESRSGVRPVALASRSRTAQPWVAQLPCLIDPRPYVAAADALLQGRWRVFALHDVQLGFPPRWNRHPQTGHEPPLRFGKRMNYRDESIVGGAIKYFWEPNRHLELVTLAQAFHLTRDMRYARACRTVLISWIEQCPYPLGLNWTSSLEHALRLVNWAVAWHVLGGEASPLFEGDEGTAFRQCWLESIYRHCEFIAGHFSLHSSANNHLLGEYMGLYVASLNWPCWDESAAWRTRARVGLEEEALKQTAPDGVNREQATWYHHEVADMMLLCGLFGRANGDEFSAAFWARLEVMLEFIAAIMDVAGNVPMMGDADDAVMVRFSREADFNPYQALLATGALLFDRPGWARKAGRCDDKTRWLLGEAASTVFDQLCALSPDCGVAKRAFPEGGYYILGERLDTPREVRLIADAGPLGYLSIAAHGHADALAFTLSVAGRELLIDPGTFTYHTQAQWRDYFRGTSAHNTLLIDGLDQSEIGGCFMWTHQARTRCLAWRSDETSDYFSGEHDGYARLPDPVLHRRDIDFDKRHRHIAVTDQVACNAEHEVALHWHFSEHCEVTAIARRVMVRHGPVTLEMSMPGIDWTPDLVRGQDTPPLGWISRHFDEKTPITTVVWRGRISATTKLVTDIKLSH